MKKIKSDKKLFFCIFYFIVCCISACSTTRNKTQDVTTSENKHLFVDTQGVCLVPSSPKTEGHIRTGMSECEFVNARGKPQGILIGINPDGRRRTEIVYEKETHELEQYIFLNGRLTGPRPLWSLGDKENSL